MYKKKAEQAKDENDSSSITSGGVGCFDRETSRFHSYYLVFHLSSGKGQLEDELR